MSALILTLVGGGLAASSANALNCYLDRDVDGIMSRTRQRPLPQGRLEPHQALVFGLATGLVGLYLLSRVNLIASVLAGIAIIYYVLIYTLWLKRSNTRSTIIGGVAGAMPPLVGWAAVTGRIETVCHYSGRYHLSLDTTPFLGTGSVAAERL